MEKQLVITKRAINSINKIYQRIYLSGYPERAEKFTQELYDFARTFKDRAEYFSLCRHKVFSRKAFKCVPFKKNYIFIIAIKQDTIYITNIVLAQRIR